MAEAVVMGISIVIAVGALALASSALFNWASGKSAVWNMGFAVVLVLLAAAVLIVAVNMAVARLGD